MPQYFYRCECGNDDQDFLPMSKSAYRPKCRCGKLMDRDIAREQNGNQSFKSACWPMRSDALGVHPDQIPEAIAEAAKSGVRVNFDGEGRAILESPKHRKEYAESMGFFDRQGGYGDPQRGGYKKYERE
jgi:hypothetical protein